MFSRQRAILRLLENEGATTSRLRLVKLAFLLSRELSAPKTGVYEFLPYRRGPFSFTLYYDIRALETDGWLVEAENEVKLTQVPDLEIAFLDRQFLEIIDGVNRQCQSMPTSALVDHVYASHPWFTMNSDAVHRRAVPRPVAEAAIYTVGYEGIMVDGLLDLLLRTGIQRLVDVRSNPIARRYGFHKSTLNRLCQDVGIEYLHIPSLGIPSAWRANVDDVASYQRLFARYEDEILPAQQASVDMVLGLLRDKPTALMCMEADHTQCHRSRLAAMVSRRTGLPIQELR